MKKRSTLFAAVVAALMLPVACGGSGNSSSNAATSAPTPTPTPTPLPVVLAAQATVAGSATTILTDAKGMTLYYFTPDKGGKITCTGGCAAIWPPLVLPAGVTKATGGPGVTGTLTTAPNPDGKGTQVLYNGWPLYEYVKDTKPGDTAGENVGQKWFVATPSLAASS